MTQASEYAAAAADIWGAIPTWISSVGAIFALGFATVAAVATWRMHRIESERDRINAEERRDQNIHVRRIQAALVSSWWGDSADTADRHGVYVRNASGAPIYQVYCTVLDIDDSSDDKKVHYPIVPPSDVALFCPVDAGVQQKGQKARDAVRRVKISFTDAAGVRWQRNQYGKLDELQSTLRVKADSDRATSLKRFGPDFLATYGVTLSFETDPDRYPQSQFMKDVQQPGVADALVCPHDWLGALTRDEVVDPVVLSSDHRAAFPKWALDAMVVNGRVYGLPTTTDTVALIRNTDLVPDVPGTIEQLIAIGYKLCEVGKASEALAVRIGPTGDPFQTWPLFTSAGGWLFGRTPDGEWDPDQIGLSSAGSIAAFERFRELGERGKKVLRRAVDVNVAFDCFASRRTAFLISTSDGVRAAREAGLNFAVSAVPPFENGSAPRAFTLVHGMAIAKHGVNKVIGHDLFQDYLTHEYVMSALSRDVVAPVSLDVGGSVRDALAEFRRLCGLGELMPSFPAMQDVWRILGEAQAAVIAGDPSEPVAQHAATAVRAAIRG